MSLPATQAAAPARGPRRLLCERVLRNAAGEAADDPRIDLLDLSWMECTRRTLQKRTRGGLEVALLLPRGSHLRHGDVLHEDAQAIVVVNVAPTDVWVVQTADAARVLAAAVELGNLHAPVEVTAAGELVLLPDGPALAVLRRNGLTHAAERRRFFPLRATVTTPVTVSNTLRIVPRS